MKQNFRTEEGIERHSVKPWARRRRIILVCGLVLFCALLALALVVGYCMNPNEYKERLNDLRAHGVPVTLAELQHWQKTLHPGTACKPQHGDRTTPTTSVDIYLKAFAAIAAAPETPKWSEIEPLLDKLRGRNAVVPDELGTIKRYLENHESTLKLLYQAATHPPGAFCLDYSKGGNIETPHFAPIRISVGLLGTQAGLAAYEGDAGKACNALMACLAVIHPLNEEPLLTSQLVRANCMGIFFESLCDVFHHGTLTEAQLEVLQQVLEEPLPPDALANAYNAERVLGIWGFEEMFPSFTSTETQPGEANTPNLGGSITKHYFGWDLGCFLQSMEELIYASRLPCPEALAIAGRIQENVAKRFIPPALTSMLIPSFAKASATVLGNGEARRILCLTAVAIERYRIVHDSSPEALVELVPGFLSALPQDPFDLQPLRYQPEENGYCLYSIGRNGTDQGGIWAETSFDGDMVFRVAWL